jgi:AcrR family transcriptional regulator
MLQATLELLAEVGFDATSIEAISARAGIGKTTIYRRHATKAEVVIPDTGNLQGDIDALIQNAAQITLSPLGRQTVATIISSAASNAQFAQIYWTKYLQPRRKTFAIVVERAKGRNEISTDLDADLVFDTMSAIMLYALIFQPTSESWTACVRRSLNLLLSNTRS